MVKSGQESTADAPQFYPNSLQAVRGAQPPPHSLSLLLHILWSLARGESPTHTSDQTPGACQYLLLRTPYVSQNIQLHKEICQPILVFPCLQTGQEKFDPPQVLLLDTSCPLGLRCKALADPEAIPFLEPSFLQNKSPALCCSVSSLAR